MPEAETFVESKAYSFIYIYIHIWTNNAWNRHIFVSGKSYDAYSGRESPQPFDWTLHQESFRYTSLCRFYLAGRCERLMVKFMLAGFYTVACFGETWPICQTFFALAELIV